MLAGAHTAAGFTRTGVRSCRCAGFATLAEAAYMAAEKVSQTRTALFALFPRLSAARRGSLRGSPPSGSSLESFSLELLVLRGARNKRIRYEFASPRASPRALSPGLEAGWTLAHCNSERGSARNSRIFAKDAFPRNSCAVTARVRRATSRLRLKFRHT